MQKFIGVKFVDAKPMTRGEYHMLRNWGHHLEKCEEDEGYLFNVAEEVMTWQPKELFKKSHLPINFEGNSITQEDVDAFIKQIHVDQSCPNDIGSTVTVVIVTLANGFTITESSTCIDPANYDAEIGIDCCMERIEDKIWYLLSFLVCCGFNGFQKGDGK
jgi:hypothetical protein